jgi:hypothetical protein
LTRLGIPLDHLRERKQQDLEYPTELMEYELGLGHPGRRKREDDPSFNTHTSYDGKAILTQPSCNFNAVLTEGKARKLNWFHTTCIEKNPPPAIPKSVLLDTSPQALNRIAVAEAAAQEAMMAAEEARNALIEAEAAQEVAVLAEEQGGEALRDEAAGDVHQEDDEDDDDVGNVECNIPCDIAFFDQEANYFSDVDSDDDEDSD